MLKIEVIKFEAQDIITASGTVEPPKDETPEVDVPSNDVPENNEGPFDPKDYPPLPDGGTNYEDYVWFIPDGSNEGMWVPADQIIPS